jgi:hypothetical protein
MRQPLSPEAQAILSTWPDDPANPLAPALLRVIADQVVPVLSDMEIARSNYSTVYEHCRVRHQLLKLATEIDALIKPPTNESI